MADMKKVYDDLIIINLYRLLKVVGILVVMPNHVLQYQTETVVGVYLATIVHTYCNSRPILSYILK